MGFFDDEEDVPASVRQLCESGSAAEFSIRLAAMGGGGLTPGAFVEMARNVENPEVADRMAEEVLDGDAFDDALCQPFFDLDYYLAASEGKKVNPNRYVKFKVLEHSQDCGRSLNMAKVMDAASRKLIRMFGDDLMSVKAYRAAYVLPGLEKGR